MLRTIHFKLFLSIMIICLAFAIQALAQNSTIDILYLKNGSIIKGNITEMVPNQTIKIRTADGSLFVFKMEDVEKVVKEDKEQKDFNQNVANLDKLSLNIFQKSQNIHPVGSFTIEGTSKGEVYLNDHLIHDIRKNTVIDLKGVEFGTHSISFKNEASSFSRIIDIEPMVVSSYIIQSDSIQNIDSKVSSELYMDKVSIGYYFNSKKNGYVNITQAGISVCLSLPYSPVGFSASTINGYKFLRHFSIGIGVGYNNTVHRVEYVYHRYKDESFQYGKTYQIHMMPIFIDTRIYFTKTRLSPFWLFDFGYIIPLGNSFQYFSNSYQETSQSV